MHVQTQVKEKPPKSAKLSWHPLSSIILTIWLAYIAVLIWLLERAADTSKSSYPQSWWNKRLSSSLLVGFAQGHAAITAMHLGRLAVSALHNRSTSARSWAELFWLADRNWQGPVGLGTASWDKWRMKRVPRFSTTFILFALTCFLALPTPYVLQRAYDEGLIYVPHQNTTVASTFTAASLVDIDQFMQLTGGEGAWVTGLPLTDIYNSSLFVPQGEPRGVYAKDVLVAGSFVGLTIRELPGLRVEADCSVVAVDTLPDLGDGWGTWCNNTFPNIEQPVWSTSRFRSTDLNIAFNQSYCTDYNDTDTQWLSSGSSKVTAFYAFRGTNSAQTEEGIMRCTSTLAVGFADADGRNGSFNSLSFALETYNNDVDFKHPLYAALFDVFLPFEVNDTSPAVVMQRERLHAMPTMLGYTKLPGDHGEGEPQYKQPNATEVAAQIQRGTLCMGAAVGALAKRPNQLVIEVSEYHAVSARVRDPPYIWGAAGLLGAWLIMIIYCTLRMFRPTFAPMLGSYSAGRLLVNEPGIVESQPVGDLSDNPNARTPFERVGDPNALLGMATGHVAPVSRPQMSPKLSSHRSYTGPASPLRSAFRNSYGGAYTAPVLDRQ